MGAWFRKGAAEESEPPLEGTITQRPFDVLFVRIALCFASGLWGTHLFLAIVSPALSIASLPPSSPQSLTLQAKVVEQMGVNLAFATMLLWSAQGHLTNQRAQRAFAWWRITSDALLTRSPGGPLVRRSWAKLRREQVQALGPQNTRQLAVALVERARGGTLPMNDAGRIGLLLTLVLGPLGYLFANFGPLHAYPDSGANWLIYCVLYGSFMLIGGVTIWWQRRKHPRLLADFDRRFATAP